MSAIINQVIPVFIDDIYQVPSMDDEGYKFQIVDCLAVDVRSSTECYQTLLLETSCITAGGRTSSAIYIHYQPSSSHLLWNHVQ